MSRKPKPTVVHLRDGTRPRRSRAAEPTPPRGLPSPPDWMSEKGRSAWGDIARILADQGVLTTADGAALQGLCEAHADWLAAARDVEAHGLTYITHNRDGEECIKANPAVAMKSDADRRRRAWLCEFGLTPAARAKVASADKGKLADPWDDF